MGVTPLVCWDCGFESGQRYRCLSLVSVVCCQGEVSASDWSLVHLVSYWACVSECDSEGSIMSRPWPTRGCWARKNKIILVNLNTLSEPESIHIAKFYVVRTCILELNCIMTKEMHEFLICLSIYFCLTCFVLSFSPSSEVGVQIQQWFRSPGYGVSPRALTPYPADLNHCLNCTPAS
jgi:hypothetical protein